MVHFLQEYNTKISKFTNLLHSLLEVSVPKWVLVENDFQGLNFGELMKVFLLQQVLLNTIIVQVDMIV